MALIKFYGVGLLLKNDDVITAAAKVQYMEPKGGGANLLFSQFPENCMKTKNILPGWGGVIFAIKICPRRSATADITFFQIIRSMLNFNLFTKRAPT